MSTSSEQLHSKWKIFSGESTDYQEWRSQACLAATTASSLHHMGLLGIILPEDEFLQFATTDDVPTPEPFQYLPSAARDVPTGDAHAPWLHTSTRKTKEQDQCLTYRLLFVSRLDSVTEVDMAEEDNNFGITRRTLKWMLNFMDKRHNVATPAAIKLNLAILDKPFVDNGQQTMKAYIATHTAAHRIAAVSGNILHQTTKVDKLITGVTQCGAFSEIILHFQLTHKTAAKQTYLGLSKLLIGFDGDRSASKVSGGSGHINQATEDALATIKALTARCEALEAHVSILSANAATAQSTGGRGGAQQQPPAAGPNARQNAGAYYCWTHGPNTTHHSPDCLFPASGHQNAATKKTKLGGALVFTSQRKSGSK